MFSLSGIILNKESLITGTNALLSYIPEYYLNNQNNSIVDDYFHCDVFMNKDTFNATNVNFSLYSDTIDFLLWPRFGVLTAACSAVSSAPPETQPNVTLYDTLYAGLLRGTVWLVHATWRVW